MPGRGEFAAKSCSVVQVSVGGSKSQLDTFSRSASGDLTLLAAVAPVVGSTSIVTSPNSEAVFIGGSQGVTIETPTPTGLNRVGTANTLTNVTQLAQSADGTVLYALGQYAGHTAIATYDVTFAGGRATLTLAGTSYGFSNATDMAVLGNDLFVTDATDGTLTTLLNTSGTLAPVGSAQVEGVGGVSGLVGASSVAAFADGGTNFDVVTSATENSAAVFQQKTDGSLEFVQLAANNAAGIAGLNDPAQIIVAGQQAFVASTGVGGGIATLNIASATAAATATPGVDANGNTIPIAAPILFDLTGTGAFGTRLRPRASTSAATRRRP